MVCVASESEARLEGPLLVLALNERDALDQLVKLLVRHARAHRAQPVRDPPFQDFDLSFVPVSPIIGHLIPGRPART